MKEWGFLAILCKHLLKPPPIFDMQVNQVEWIGIGFVAIQIDSLYTGCK